ncbi:uncharacterized protein isoform X2 [Leptinotarsa decemlineata]|uniref:uncharacterized protein isoform X2 n=1 Tax=Leptinotarsa decemlineata TaxID=7539 RepID=UPI003D30B029
MGLVSIKCDLVQRIFVVRDFRVWKMPSDIISFAVSTGLGVSVLAGILSGVCYVLAHGKHKNSNRKLTKEWYCDVCGIYLRSIERILGGDEAVTCIKCRGRVCRRKCSSLNEQRSGWTCKNCLRPPESWFRGILNAIHPAKKVEIEVNMQSEPLDEVDEDLEELKKKGKEQVQDFLEKLVNGMLGQNVDDASVTKTYNDELYLPLTGQSPCTAHAALKQLIERLLKEVVNLPSLQKTQENSALSSDLNNKTYEDLLATAILNKVISSSQNTLPSSSAASVSSRPTSSLGRRDDKEYFFGEETLESKWKTADLESTSISSLEEWIQSDSSFGTRKYVDRLTLTIKQDIEEVSSTDSENEDDDNDDKEYFHQKSLLSDDEPNWFLQKRQFQGTASPVPVPMLVPSPAIEAKVLIGDTEADETSDLSDVGSDFEETGKTPGTHGLLVEAKTIIGGKNPAVQNGGSESESSADSGVKEVDRDRFEYDDSDFVQRTDITVDDDNVEDASLLSVYSNIEQEAEYTERYASLPRTIMKTPTPPARPSLQKEMYPDGAKITQATVNHTHEKESDEEDENILERQFSGTYSRREKEKWKHAIEMKNNPYSKENIENRIKRSNSAVSSLFGPDYYAKLASSPTGEKKKSQKGKLIDKYPGFPSNDEEIIGDILKTNDQPQKLEVNWPPAEAKNEGIHTAIPVILLDSDEVDSSQTRIQIESREEPSIEEYTTSDSDYINCYEVETSQVYKKSREKSDENGNHSQEEDKQSKIEQERQPTQPREKPRFLKLNAPVTSSGRTKKSDPRVLKRTQSESDLLNESFYTPPRVLEKRKDNTLISKIYQDPRVQSFALSSRNKIPVVADSRTFRKQTSVPDIVLQDRNNDQNTMYNSDEGAMMKETTNHAFYSSEEDFLVPKANEVPKAKIHRLNSSAFSYSSEDLPSEPSSANLERSKMSKPYAFSSFEDLLSSEEYEQPLPKKKDNTLISKIYQQQHVRNYALSNRDYIPDSGPFKETASFENNLSDDNNRAKQLNKKITVMEQNAAPEKIHLEPLSIVKSLDSSEEFKHDRNITTSDQEISEIAKKKIVHNFLDQIASGQPKPNPSRRNIIEDFPETAEDEEKILSVKELRRKFEKDQGKSKVVSSLTARNLSKQMKTTWKN